MVRGLISRHSIGVREQSPGSYSRDNQGFHRIIIMDLRILRTEASAADHCRTDQRDKAGAGAGRSPGHIRRKAEPLSMDRRHSGTAVHIPDEPCRKEGRH